MTERSVATSEAHESGHIAVETGVFAIDGVLMKAATKPAPPDLVAAVGNASVASFERAARQIASVAMRSPLLPFASDAARAVRLKAENLQPFGSFKIRCGANAIAELGETSGGAVATASAGNFAQGLALAARQRGIHVTVHVPETAAGVKLESVRALGAKIVRHSFADWWQIMSSRDTGMDDGTFVHPVASPAVILGNGTIGIELAADWPEIDTVVVPFGGGGLIAGIALALRAAGRSVRVVACEAETSTPLSAAFANGGPVRVERHPSFIDGIGSHSVLEEMWPLLRDLVDDVVIVSVAEVKAAIQTLALRNRLIVEGAGGAALAAALSPRCGGRNVVAVLSEGNSTRRD